MFGEEKFGGFIRNVQLANFNFGLSQEESICFCARLTQDFANRFEEDSHIRSSPIESFEWDNENDCMVIITRNTIYLSREDFLSTDYSLVINEKTFTKDIAAIILDANSKSVGR